MKIIEQINKILEKQQNKKQFYFLSDGYQECIMFYCEKAWANKFKDKTGIVLKTTINE